MTEKLKPCPFCGGDVETNTSSVIEQIYCPNCGATTVWSTFSVSREHWNKRTKKETRLKLCPICGNRAIIHKAYDGTFCVQCPKCTLTSPYKSTKEEAIKAWNRRINDE